MDADLLAAGHQRHHRGAVLGALGGLATRRELLDAYLGGGGRRTSRLDWYMAMACFKLGVVIEGTWSRYLMGMASRDAGEALHFNAQNLIDMGTRVAKGDNPFQLDVARTRRSRA